MSDVLSFRFQGSNSISSDMYFNRESGGGNVKQSQSYQNFQTPDMDDVKESVRQGVTKVAGRLSGMASGVMNSIQVNNGASAYYDHRDMSRRCPHWSRAS